MFQYVRFLYIPICILSSNFDFVRYVSIHVLIYFCRVQQFAIFQFAHSVKLFLQFYILYYVLPAEFVLRSKHLEPWKS